jgi:DNA mismatch repair protein MutS
MDEPDKLTPMMKQFFEIKNLHKDCILLFRAGDFYETFYEDAKTCSKLLGITLTKRAQIPMAGVPFHSITPYIKKLIENNLKVAICEQLEDPKNAKGIVKRGVTRIITPGTILEDEYLNSFENNYIMCIYSSKNKDEKNGISIVDLSTGEFIVTEIEKQEDIKNLIKKYQPNEIILNESNNSKLLIPYLKNANRYYNFLSENRFNLNYAKEIIKRQFKKTSSQLKLDEKEFALISSAALLFYIYKLQKLELTHINTITYIENENNLILDSITLKNLEITENVYLNDKSKTLFGILNNCKTASGSRLLKKYLKSPLIDSNEINNIYDSIEELNYLTIQRDEIRNLLDEFFDIERICSRIASNLASPKDLYALKLSLKKIPLLKKILIPFKSKHLVNIKNTNSLENISNLLEQSISEMAPSHTRDIGYIKKNFNENLKKLFEISSSSKTYIKELEEEERLKTKIPTLKIKFNKIFGYYIEIPKSQESKVPENYQIKQNLVNVTRYIEDKLKEKENLILNAEDKIKNLEKEIYDEIIKKLQNYIKEFQKISKNIAMLDFLSNHSFNAQIFNYSRPTFSLDNTTIEEGRNPIVEKFTHNFISNDTYFDKNETFKIITGPNMSGKSTYLRQNALISIMAQSGSFIPVKKANLKIYKRIFTRIGAHDELSEGQSTFMVEMSETANILNNANEHSLVLLDEIGRGTSTYDGLSIAWAITEELARIKCHSIFATHYHHLNTLSNYYSNIKNYNVQVQEEGEKIKFIHKIIPGGTDKSYGIYVAKLAGIPESVLKRAIEIQESIENKKEVKISKNLIFSKNKKTKYNHTSTKNSLNKFI